MKYIELVLLKYKYLDCNGILLFIILWSMEQVSIITDF
jgi:hypothetical protein